MFIASASPHEPSSVGAAQCPAKPALVMPPREAPQVIGKIMKRKNDEPAKPGKVRASHHLLHGEELTFAKPSCGRLVYMAEKQEEALQQKIREESGIVGRYERRQFPSLERSTRPRSCSYKHAH